jgi:hypothetical protein
MNITMKTLSALAIATAALAATVMQSNAGTFTVSGAAGTTAVGQQPTKNPGGTQTTQLPPGAGRLIGHGPYKCLVCEVPFPPKPTGGDHDHDHDHDHDGWGRWHGGYGYGAPPVIVEAPPAIVEAPPVRVSAPAPVRAAAPQPQAQLQGEPCNCLTKQSLPDGSVLFQDICTKESALAPAPQPVGAR